MLQLQANGTVDHRLLWGPAVDEALADETAGTTYWYLTDNLGTVRDVATYNGGTTTIANHIAFDSFGRKTESAPTLADFDVRYTGKWTDSATGLQWNLNRWYNPTIQRWMSEDPLGLRPDANPSRYVGNAPTMYVDPDGLEARGYWGGVGEVFIGYGNAAVGTVKGGWFIIRHPIQTVKGVGTAIAHPIRTGQAICEDIYDKSGSLRGQGELVGDVLIGVATGGAMKAASKSSTVVKITNKLDDVAPKGLTTPSKYFGNKTAQEVSEAMTKKFGTPKSVRECAETFYNPKTQRSFNVHTDPAHGPPHVDVRRRGGFPERKYPLGEETP